MNELDPIIKTGEKLLESIKRLEAENKELREVVALLSKTNEVVCDYVLDENEIRTIAKY